MAGSAPGVGDLAPEISLPATGGRTYTLSEFRGQPVVLAFYPGDNTAVCTRQLCSYSADLSQFEGLGAALWAISPQDVASHEGFVAKSGLTMPLLADTDKAAGRAYGVLGPAGFYRRSVFVIDSGGVIRYAHRAMAGLTFRPSSDLLEAVRQSKA
ncbi:MAG: peroxiredoxin [Acidimicrobiales bacterium]